MDEETWFTMSEDERQEYTDMLFKTKLEEVEFVNCEREGSLNRTIPYDLSLTFDEFKPFLPQYSSDTVRGIYQKAYQLKNNPRAITFVPGCDAKSRMVISARLKDKPHHVKKGKGQGEYQCSRSCPHWGH